MKWNQKPLKTVSFIPIFYRLTTGVFEDNNSGSNLTELCKVANVEVDLSAVNEENKCFNEDENWDMIVAELKNIAWEWQRRKQKWRFQCWHWADWPKGYAF